MQISAREGTSNPPSIQMIDGFNSTAFFEKVISLVPGIIYVFNQKMMSNEYSNRSIATLLGYSAEEIIDMGDALLESVIHPGDLGGIIAHFQELNALDDGDSAEFEYRAKTRDGSLVWLRNIDAVFQRAADGTVLRHVGCASDVAGQKTRSLELSRLNDNLEARIHERTQELADLNLSLETKVENRTAELVGTNDELEQLTYIATHDLKVPISNLSHLTKMLEEEGDALSADQRGLVRMMKTSCLQASDKLEGLVRVARAGSADLSPRIPVVLAVVAGGACTALDHTIKQCGAEVTLDFSAAPNIEYPLFEAASLFENLIGNGLKYSHPDRSQKCICTVGRSPMACVSLFGTTAPG